jgi:hypothetical protein
MTRMENIRSELEIDQKLGTYVASHSFSTVLKRKGIYHQSLLKKV